MSDVESISSKTDVPGTGQHISENTDDAGFVAFDLFKVYLDKKNSVH